MRTVFPLDFGEERMMSIRVVRLVEEVKQSCSMMDKITCV